MNIDSYLKRINSENLKETSLENLKLLHSKHLLNIPFENLSVALNEHVKMDIEPIYDKIINKNRGGFCFELNQLFAWLLKSIGYDITLISCRVFQVTAQVYSPWFSHLAILVKLDEKVYLVDVGFSSSFFHPLEFIPNKIQLDKIGHFCIKNDVTDENQTKLENCFTLYRTVKDVRNNEWKNVYQLDIRPRKIEDYEEMLEYVQSRACARFYNRSFAIRHTQTSIKMLMVYTYSNAVYDQNGNEIHTEEYEIDKEKINDVLRDEFNIRLEKHFVPRNINL